MIGEPKAKMHSPLSPIKEVNRLPLSTKEWKLAPTKSVVDSEDYSTVLMVSVVDLKRKRKTY